MKLESKTADVSGKIGIKSTKAKLSQADMQKMYELIQSPYKNPIGAIVKEYTSNAIDSHIEAGVDDAVIVKLGRDETLGYYIKFVDVGVGLSPDRMEHVFMNIFASTKEHTNDMIGCFGIGSKSGISYNPFFYINTHYDGITYKYIYRKGQLEPELDLLEEYEEKDRRNGSEFIVPIKSEEDLFKFAAECERQLYYFTNVVFDIAELENYLDYYDFERIKPLQDQDYKIYEGKTFKARINKDGHNDSFNHLHISLGPVSYPIDSGNYMVDSKLDFNTIALKFDIGELDVIQTREDVKYTEKTLIAIDNKVRAFKKELLDLYGTETLKIHTRFKDYLQGVSEVNTLVLGKDDYILTLTGNLFPKKNHVLKAFYNIDKTYKVPTDLLDNCYRGYSITEAIKHSSEGRVRLNTGDFYESINDLSNQGAKYYFSKRQLMDKNLLTNIKNGNINVTIKSNRNSHSVKINKQIVVKDCDVPIGKAIPVIYGEHPNNLKYYINILQLSTVHKSKWRPIIKTFKAIRDKVFSNFLALPNVIEYEKVKINEKWLSDYNKKYRKNVERDNTLISAVIRTDKWDSENFKLHEICYPKGVVIYTDKEDKDKLMKYRDDLFRLSYYSHGMYYDYKKFIAVSKTNVKKIGKYVKENNIKNVMSLEEYKNNKNNLAYRNLADLYVYLKYEEQLQNINSIKNDISNYDFLEYYYPKVNEKVKSIQQYFNDIQSKYHLYGSSSRMKTLKLLVNDIESLSDFAEIKKHETITLIKDLDMFLSYFNPLIYLVSNTEGYSGIRVTNGTIKLINIYLTNMKLVDNNFVMEDNLCKTISEAEYELLLNQAKNNSRMVRQEGQHSINSFNKEESQAAFLINKYEIKNNLKLTEWNL